MADDTIVVRDRYRRWGIVGMILLYMLAVLALTDRSLPFGRRALILPGASIATAAAPAGYADALDQYGVHLSKRGGAGPAQSAPLAPPDRLHFGYSVMETSILGAPYWVGRDDGDVVYYETLREFVYAPVSDDYMRKVHLPGPVPLASQHFAWWGHVWGWVLPIALGGWGWFEIGAARRKRDIEGVI